MTDNTIKNVQSQGILQDRIARYAEEGVDAINVRLSLIESEWSAGRLVKAVTGIAIVSGLALSALHDPLWLLLPAVAGAFLLQYVFFRCSILAEFFQKTGWRAGYVIDEEKLALRALRGDFRNLPTVDQVEDRDAVCRLQNEGGPARDDDEDRYGPKEIAVLIAAVAR